MSEQTSNQKLEVKTIHQFLADNPNVDVSAAWKRCWNTLEGVANRVRQRFDVSKHPSCADREYYTSPTGSWEGSLNTYTGPKVDWLVHSWLGDRKNSILDMNATVFLGQDTTVPHLVLVFGTIPQVFFYADYVPRSDIRVDEDYLKRYFDTPDLKEQYLGLRGDSRFTWSVSHGTYMRAMASPVCASYTAEMSDGVLDTLDTYVTRFTDRWFNWLDEAEPVPEQDRAELQGRDFKVRELGYRLDPMNALAAKVFGADKVDEMVEMRMGREQMNKARR